MMLRKMAAALLLLTAAMPALADDAAGTDQPAAQKHPKKPRTRKTGQQPAHAPDGVAPDLDGRIDVSGDIGGSGPGEMKPSPVPKTDQSIATSSMTDPESTGPFIDGCEDPQDVDLPLLTAPKQKPESKKAESIEPPTAKTNPTELSLDDLVQRAVLFSQPTRTMDGNDKVCIFPFVQGDTGNENTKTLEINKSALDDTYRIFAQVGRASPTLHVRAIEPPKSCAIQKHCGVDQPECLAHLGVANGCTVVLIGYSDHTDTGFVLRARFIDTKDKIHRVLSKLDAPTNTRVPPSEINNSPPDPNAVRQVATGLQACTSLLVPRESCTATLTVSSDLPELVGKVGGRVFQSGVTDPHVPLGAYTVDAQIQGKGPKTEHYYARYGQAQTIYLREYRNKDNDLIGDINIIFSDGTLSAPPPDSRRPRWRGGRIIGGILAGVGLAAEGFAVGEFAHSQSLANGAANDANANGYYKPGDLAAVSSAHTSKDLSLGGAGVGALLFVAGGIILWVTR